MAKQTVLITGCSAKGIGSALAEAFLAKGYHVFATTRDLAKMAHLEGKADVTLLKLDVNEAEHITAALEAVRSHDPNKEGKLDCLVNNSGRNFFAPVLDIDIEDAKRMYDTNLWGALRLIQAFAPYLIKSKGHIVNICSISGCLNVPWMGIYAASKKSLEILSETLRLELAPLGVGVLGVLTGAVQSQGQTYFDDFTLPESSLYKNIEDIIASRAQGNDGVSRTPTNKYAEQVVNDVQARKVGLVWRGNAAGGTRLLQHLPQSIMDKGFSKGTGLDQVSPSTQS